MAKQIFGVSALRVKIGKTFRISFKKLKTFKNRNPKKSAKIRETKFAKVRGTKTMPRITEQSKKYVVCRIWL